MIKTYTISDEIGTRLDVFLAGQEDNPSRASIQKMITDGAITVNNKLIKIKISPPCHGRLAI